MTKVTPACDPPHTELTAPAETIVSGVNVTALFQTVEAVQVNPLIAQFRFKVRNQWRDGPHNRSSVNGFHGALQDIERSQTFVLQADEHPMLLGRDQGPNPGESQPPEPNTHFPVTLWKSRQVPSVTLRPRPA